MSLSFTEKDEVLIADLQSGIEARINRATSKLHKTTYWRVLRIVRIGGGIEEDAKTILDDALLDLIKLVQARRFKSEKGTLANLLFVICKNNWLDELKVRYQSAQNQELLTKHYLQESPMDKSTAESEISKKEDREIVIRALQQLDENCLRLLRMKYLEGISLKVIAERLDRKENTVRQQHKRCKNKLREILGSDPRV